MLKEIRAPEQLKAWLTQDAGRYLYELGDLDPFFWPHTRWLAWQHQQVIEALALLYHGDDLPVLLLNADNRSAARQLLAASAPQLPSPCYAHLSPGLQSALPDSFTCSGGEPHLRMLLTQPQALQRWALPVAAEARVLGPDQTPEVQDFLDTHYPGNWFNARMLATGAYLGLYWQGELRAVAGVHVYAPDLGVAALGNIAVDQAFRGQNIGRLVTARLCEHLLAQGIRLIGLNVHEQNLAAIRCYQSLGFEVYRAYQEWLLTRLAQSAG